MRQIAGEVRRDRQRVLKEALDGLDFLVWSLFAEAGSLLLRLPSGLVEILVYCGLPGGHGFRQQLVAVLFRDN